MRIHDGQSEELGYLSCRHLDGIVRQFEIPMLKHYQVSFRHHNSASAHYLYISDNCEH